MKTFFIADCHFDHAKFYEPQVTRPFSMDEWNTMLLDKINSMVDRADRLLFSATLLGSDLVTGGNRFGVVT